MAGIDMSKLERVNVDTEETTTSSANNSYPNVPVGSPMPITQNPQPNNSEIANTVSGGFNVGYKMASVGASFGKKSFTPMLVGNALQVIGTALQVYQNVRAEEELTKRYEDWTKMQTTTFIAAEQEKTARVHNIEETKRAQIQKDSEIRHHELYNELKKMELSYQKKDSELELQRTEMEHLYQMLNNTLNNLLEKHKAYQTAYIASNCNNAELKEQLNRTEDGINNFITQCFQYLQGKTDVRSE